MRYCIFTGIRQRLPHALAALLAYFIGIIANHNVLTVPSKADDRVARKILERAGYNASWFDRLNLKDLDDQVKIVVAVQDAVLQASPKQSGNVSGD